MKLPVLPARVIVVVVILVAAIGRNGQPQSQPGPTACDTDALTSSFGSTFALGSQFAPIGGVSVGTGWFRLNTADVQSSSPLAGTFTRAYNSGDTRTTALGPGWTSNAQVRLRLEGSSPDILMTLPDGAVERFKGAVSNDHSIGTSRGYRELDRQADGRSIVHDDGRIWTFESTGRLARVDDPSGDWVELLYNGDKLQSTVGPDGPGLTFEFGVDGRMKRVSSATDPKVFVAYEYDAIGRLTRAAPSNGAVRRYTYVQDTQQIATITDDAGSVLLRLDYDDRGRVIRDRDARGLSNGDAITFVYEEVPDGGRRTTVTYPVSAFEPGWHPIQVVTEDRQSRLRTLSLRPTSWAVLIGRYDYDAENRRIALDPRPCPALNAPRPNPGQVAVR